MRRIQNEKRIAIEVETCEDFDVKRLKRRFRKFFKRFDSVVYITCCKALSDKIRGVLGEGVEVYTLSEFLRKKSFETKRGCINECEKGL